jgi:hypothetical protein
MHDYVAEALADMPATLEYDPPKGREHLPALTFLDPTAWQGSRSPASLACTEPRPRGNVTILYGDGAAGKTLIALQLLYFEGKDKGLILNKTNSNNVAAAYGDETDRWQGQDVVLYPNMVDFQGRSVEAIRLRRPSAKDAPAKTATAVKPDRDDPRTAVEPDDDIPF